MKVKLYDPFPRHYGTPMVANVCAHTRTARMVNVIHVAKIRPNVRVLKSGKRRITF